MSKRVIFSIIIMLVITALSLKSLANDEIVGGVTGNVLNNTGNVVNNVANGVSETVDGAVNIAGDVGSGLTNMAGSASNKVIEGSQSMANFIIPDNSLRSDTMTEYNATAMNANAVNTFLGLNTTAWWWIIIGIICFLLIVLLWNRMNNVNHSGSDD